MTKFAPNIFITCLFLFVLFTVMSTMYSLTYDQPEPIVVTVIRCLQGIGAILSLIYVYINRDIWYY